MYGSGRRLRKSYGEVRLNMKIWFKVHGSVDPRLTLLAMLHHKVPLCLQTWELKTLETEPANRPGQPVSRRLLAELRTSHWSPPKVSGFDGSVELVSICSLHRIGYRVRTEVTDIAVVLAPNRSWR